MSLITLVKDGNECNVEKSQVAAMKAAGWREPGEHAAEGATNDGGEQQPGRTLDREQRSGEDEPGPVEPERVEQPPSPVEVWPEGG